VECVVILAMGLFFSAPPVEDVRRAVSEVYREEELQSRFSRGEKAIVERPVERPKEKPADPRTPTGSAVEALLWVLIIASVAVAAVYLTQRLGGYTADLEVSGGAGGTAAAARAPPPADEARRLAAEGQFEEAIHLLLLLALHPLTEERHLGGSLTSREIIRTVDLPDPAREAVEGLRIAVEISVFGGLPPTRADFDACERQFDRYCAALGVEPA
jgi:hypothetical protein